jgi:hypothetical protein
MKPIDIQQITAFYKSELEKYKECGIITARSVVKASEATAKKFTFSITEAQ